MESFRRKGRFEQLMTNMPVHVITTRVALIGIARFGLRRDKNSQGIVSSSLPNGGSS
jgi:hypothetical protein